MYRKKRKKLKRKSKVGIILFNHITNNKRGYVITTILFFVGIIAAVIFVNSIQDSNANEIKIYLNELMDKARTYKNLDLSFILKEEITLNFIIIFILWFAASTLIGIVFLYGIILLKGFSIGYTISCMIISFGTGKGILISLSIMLLHNIIYIPSILATGVSGVKLYKSIMQNKDKDYIKTEMLRHTIFCVLMLILLILSSLIEVYISTNILIMLLKKI